MDLNDTVKDGEQILIPRAYQLEILEVAKVRNTLAFLPTASGKTLISLLLIKHRLNESRKTNGPKRSIAFLAPTRSLVSQQRKYIEANFGSAVVVREYIGETSRNGRKINDWNAENWLIEVQETDVMVFIPQVIKAMLQGAFLPISAFDLFVLDECHHAFKQDPMAVVCALIKASKWQPLVLGLTASPLPCKKGLISARIAALEEVTGCKLICPKDSIEDLRTHVPIPNLALLRHGYVSDRSPRGAESPFNDSTALVSMDVANKLFQGMKIKPAWKVEQSFLSVRDNGNAVISHALLRVIQADNVFTLHKLLSTMQMHPADLEAKCHLGTLLPAAGMLPNQLSGSSLSDIQQVGGQIQRIVLDCGVLCGIWALAISMDPKRVDYLVGKSTSSTSSSLNSDASKESVSRVSSVSVSTVDFEKYQGLVDRLKNSPFTIEALLMGQNVACCSLLDILAALAMPLGPSVCQRAADRLLLRSAFIDEISFADVSPSSSNTTFSDTTKSRHHSTDRSNRCNTSPVEKANEVVICMLQACADRCSQSNDSIDNGSLCFLVGSDGVTTSIASDHYSSKENPLTLDCLKQSICDCCVALLGVIAHDELQAALSLPLTPTSNGEASQIFIPDTSLISEPKMRIDVEMFSAEASQREISKESSHSQGLEKSEKDSNYKALLNQPYVVVTAKVVALFHFWKEIGKHKQIGLIQKDGDCTSGTGMTANMSNPHVGHCSSGGNSDCRLRSDYIGLIGSELAENWGAIVFCKMRLTAMSLCRLLDMLHRSSISQATSMGVIRTRAQIDDFKDSSLATLKGSCLVGQCKLNEQIETLRRFDAGDFNLLFATDVAEEGLDLRSCQLIINFDSPDTVKSFIQRKGRARSQNSYIISLVPFGVQGIGHLRDLAAFCGQEQEMLQHGNELPPETTSSSSACTLVDILRIGAQAVSREVLISSQIRTVTAAELVPLTAAAAAVVCTSMSNFDNNLMKEVHLKHEKDDNSVHNSCRGIEEEHLTSYVSPSGATVDLISALQLLSQYCVQLPHDSFYIPEPIMWITKHSAPLPVTQEYRCSILLPSSVPPHLRCIMGPKMPTKSAARNVACLQCVRALHVNGEINDWFCAVDLKVSDKIEEKARGPVDAEMDQKDKCKKPLSEGDLVELMIKTVPNYLMVPAAAAIVSPVTSPTCALDASGELIDPAHSSQGLCDEIKGESNSADTVLHMYRVTSSCSNAETERIVTRCHGCFEYLKGLNRVGFSLLSPLSADVLSTPMSMTLREREDLISKIVYLGTKSVSSQDLKEMQLFHRGILCWEAEKDYSKRMDCTSGRFITSITSSSSSKSSTLSHSSSLRSALSHDEWAESGGGAWYCLFPLPDEMAIPSLRQSRNTAGGYSRNSSPSRLASESSSRRNSFSANSSPFTDGMISTVFSDPESWSKFLAKSAAEAQILAHNLRMQKEINEWSFKDKENVFGDPLRRFSQATVDDMCDKIITKGRGGIFVSAATNNSGSHLNDVLKMVSEVDTPTYEGYSRADHISSKFCQCGCVHIRDPKILDLEEGEVAEIPVAEKKRGKSSCTVPITFRDHMCSKHKNAIPFINELSCDPTHQLLSMVAITNRLTLCPLLGSLKLAKPIDAKSPVKSNVTGEMCSNCVQYTAISRGRQDTSSRNPLINCTAENCISNCRPILKRSNSGKSHKRHTHSDSIMMAPEFCRVVGEAKWFFCGLVAPSVIWRMQSLVLAEEARSAIMVLVDAIPTDMRSQEETMIENEVTELVKMTGVKSSMPIILPSSIIMLEAITPRMAGERLNSERLEHLGDCLLKLVTTVELYRIYPFKYEGFMTTMRSQTISNLHLYNMARALDMGKYLRAAALSNGKQTLMFSPAGIPPRYKSRQELSCWNINLTPPPDVVEKGLGQVKGLIIAPATTPSTVHISDTTSSAPVIRGWFVPKSKRKRLKTDSPESLELEGNEVPERTAVDIPSFGSFSLPDLSTDLGSPELSSDSEFLRGEVHVVSSTTPTSIAASPVGSDSSDYDSSVDKSYVRDGSSDTGPVDRRSRKKSRRKTASVSSYVGVEQVTIKVKALADFMEALIGAFYVQGGMCSAVALVRALGAWPETPQQPLSNLALSSTVANTESISSINSSSYCNGAMFCDTGGNDDLNNDSAKSERIQKGNILLPPSSRLAQIPNGYPEELRKLAHGDADHTFRAQSEVFSKEGDGCGSQTPYRQPSSTTYENSSHDCNNPSTIISTISSSIHRKLGYHFKDNSLLTLALTHCSVQHALSNQRLEFLGDAVLDFVVVKQLHSFFEGQDYGPGEISIRKNELTNNRSLGIIALKLRLFEELNVNAINLVKEFTLVGKILHGINFSRNTNSTANTSQYYTAAASSRAIDFSKANEGRLSAPEECPEIEEALKHASTVNALADVIEALIGAVFLDSHGCLDTVLRLVRKIGMDL